jgi:ribulose-5-phosphate 4-epimerase/fuculose-1-phosphate aldolase
MRWAGTKPFDVGPIKNFIQDTNCIIMKRHGFTVLGRTVSEAYHRPACW